MRPHPYMGRLLLGALLAAAGCTKPASGPTPPVVAADAGPEPTVDLSDPWFANLTEADQAVLERALAGHPRWAVMEEARPTAKRFAVRLEPGPKDEIVGEGEEVREVLIPGGYRGGSNGFYSDFDSKTVVQRRVLLGMGREYGFGREPGLTRAKAGQGTVPIQLFDSGRGQPGESSYLVVQGAHGWTLEIFEQSHVQRREFTEKALVEVMAELKAALAAREEILAKGYNGKLLGEARLRKGPALLRVDPGMQPGMFVLVGGANPGEPGRTFARVVFVGPDPKIGPSKVPPDLKPGDVLSEDRVTPSSTRWIGWGPEADTLFPYQAGMTVYEGDWEHFYRARFELWFQPEKGGAARKLAEATETISGWQR